MLIHHRLNVFLRNPPPPKGGTGGLLAPADPRMRSRTLKRAGRAGAGRAGAGACSPDRRPTAGAFPAAVGAAARGFWDRCNRVQH